MAFGNISESIGVESKRGESSRFWRLANYGVVRYSVIIRFGRIEVRNEGHRRLRKTYASICLLVVTLIYAPLAAAAWTTYQSSCCKNGQCSIAAHHHQRQAPAAPKHQMDCGHERGHEMSGMMACAMSCCHDRDGSLVTPVAFVLPPTAVLAENFETSSAIISTKPLDSPRYLEPASPPPRP